MNSTISALMAGALLIFGAACDDNAKGGAQNETIDRVSEDD